MASVGTDPSVHKAINTLDSELQAKFGRLFFDNTGRGQDPRGMIMGLPMDSGWMVFRALQLQVPVAKNPDELRHELHLICKLGWQALHDLAVSNPTGYMEGNTLDTPRNVEQVHNHIVQPKACWTDPAVDTNINLERRALKARPVRQTGLGFRRGESGDSEARTRRWKNQAC